MAKLYDITSERTKRSGGKRGPRHDGEYRAEVRRKRDLAITLHNMGKTYAQIAELLEYANASCAYHLIHKTRIRGDDAAS